MFDFKISDKLLKQILKNLSTVRNMVIRCMEKLLTKEQYDNLYNSIIEEIDNISKKLKLLSLISTKTQLKIF